jgi:hypothetical protein
MFGIEVLVIGCRCGDLFIRLLVSPLSSWNGNALFGITILLISLLDGLLCATRLT